MDETDLDRQLPIPCGYKLLVALPPAEEKSEGGIVLAADTLERERIASVVGRVIDMGPDAYTGETSKGAQRFPNGPYCKIGDWIIMRAFAGTRIRVHGQEYRLLNDDSVDAVVTDPKGIQKV